MTRKMATLRWKPTGGVGLNNFDKHAINTHLTPAVAAAAAKLGAPLLDMRPAFGGRPTCPKRAFSCVSSSAARAPAGWICLIPGCSTQHPRAESPSRSDRHEGLWCKRQHSARVNARAFALSTPRLPGQRECVLRAARTRRAAYHVGRRGRGRTDRACVGACARAPLRLL